MTMTTTMPADAVCREVVPRDPRRQTLVGDRFEDPEEGPYEVLEFGRVQITLNYERSGKAFVKTGTWAFFCEFHRYLGRAHKEASHG